MPSNLGAEPAFPVPPDYYTGGGRREECHGGMSTRYWFAGKALQGILSNPEYMKLVLNSATELKVSQADVASKDACQYADALLTERGR